MAPFIIYALPRSRTAWLAEFLTFGGWTCYHDFAAKAASVSQVKALLDRPNTGLCETAMVEGWRLIQTMYPDARVVVVRRPVEDVSDSLSRFGIKNDDELLRREALLEEVSALPDTLTLDFDDLDSHDICDSLFRYCLGQPLPDAHWKAFKDKNVQINMLQRLAEIDANRHNTAALRAEVAQLSGVDA